MKKLTSILLLAPVLVVLPVPAVTAAEGDWRFTVGAHNVDPKSDNGVLVNGTLGVDVGSDVRPTFTGEYMFNDAWGLEVLASLPFTHEVKLNGAVAGEVSHLPPTVSLQYHFNAGEKVSPYLGAGVNYTWIHDEDPAGLIEGADLDLDNSVGLALHAGVDFAMQNDWFFGVDARWMDIDADATIDGIDIGTVNIDPLVYGFYFGKRF